MPQRPEFIYPGGSPLMHPTLELKQSEMYGFFLRGDLARLQATVDQTLNAVASPAMRFEVLSRIVMLTFTRVQHANSAWPMDRAKGWGEEIDIVTWVVVGQRQAGEHGIGDVFFYPCHIWVDDCMALINGRELYGYPKYQCEYTMPVGDEPATRFALSAKGFEPFSPQTKLAMHPLLEVDATSGGKPATPLQRLEDLAEQAIALMAADLPAFLALDPQGWAHVAQMLRSLSIEQIFLKQFPDASGIKAVYQALVAAPAKVTEVRHVHLLGDEFRCTLHPFASFPLNETLGLAIGGQPATLPFHLALDFEVTPGREVVDNSRVSPRKIAIIGGGVAAMTAAFYLSDSPGWRNEREITVYQMGWRLGGKGASGRNAAMGQRIEEHGLHIWFGFYDNAFRTIQQVYALANRPEGAPLRTWQDAFRPQHFVTLTELIDGQCKLWPIDTPPTPGLPGDGDEKLDLWRIALTAYEWIRQWLHTLCVEHAHPQEPVRAVTAGRGPGSWLHELAQRVSQDVDALADDVTACLDALHGCAKLLSAAPRQGGDHALQSAALRGLREWLSHRFGDRAQDRGAADALRRLYICADLAISALIGMFEDGVFTHGFDVINGEDFRQWLARHGANPVLTVDSAPVRGFYDLVFAFEDGDFARPNIEAGTMLRGMMRVAFDYHGAIMWKMQAGMGDVVFAPMYEVLRRRGVKFEFFHKVEELVPDASGDAVAEIRMTRQVELAPGRDAYEPLVDVKGLPCWPSTPLLRAARSRAGCIAAGRIDQSRIAMERLARTLREGFRQAAATGQVAPGHGLRHGDLWRLGRLVRGAVPAVPRAPSRTEGLHGSREGRGDAGLPDLARRAPARAGLDAATAATGSRRCSAPSASPSIPGRRWTRCCAAKIGRPAPRRARCRTSAARCRWRSTRRPRIYGFPARMASQVKAAAIGQMNRQIGALWPESVHATGFDWSKLFDPGGGQGVQRFDSQYWRANVDPSERYVVSLVGSSRYRLAADGTGVSNLLVAGDWIRTGLNAGCVEAATMAGMQASRAMCGHPAKIVGDRDS